MTNSQEYLLSLSNSRKRLKPYGGYPPHNATKTSQAASQSMVQHVTTQERVVLNKILSSGEIGMTDDAIEAATGLRHQSVSARRRTLYLKGLITYKLDKKGSKTKHKTRSGRGAYVFVAS